MELNNKITIETMNHNSYSLISNSGVILSEEGLKNSSSKRLNLLSQMEKHCTLKENRRALNSDETKEIIKRHGLTELIIEVTSACNMRCTYCIFGENYEELRKHENKNMNFDMAKSAIDTYFELFKEARIYNPDRVPMIAFYGGEPLLNFDLIKRCTNYIKTIYEDEVLITLTSNGYLLTEEIAYFFKENSILPIFSLDGPKTEHDLHRVTGKNKGSFDVVMPKLKMTHEILGMPLFVNSVFSYDTDLNAVIDFFAEHQEFICINLSPVSPVNTTYYDDFSQDVVRKFLDTYNSLQEEFYSYARNKKEETTLKEKKRIYLLDILFSKRCMNVIMRQIVNNEKPGVAYTATCIPGERLFVDVDGLYYPCEKISRSRNIGNIHEGLDYNSITKYVNEYKSKIVDNCSMCNIKKVCSACFNTFLIDGEFVKDQSICQSNCESFAESFSNYCYLNELDETWLDKFRTEYYKKVKELVVTLR
ncbi:radical SAM protein [Paraclostridium bifermentans]|nr:radical SAM protein [Paraclostridium bifermentans]